ncbi:MAG TPA: VOC family protein [Candidatus Dormibacteraeota bacterium]|nr:VOC family protein [Candidatus Dormibacteraeota bacterium]
MTVDHIVYGVDDLQAGIDELSERLGVRAAPGGKHVGRGTHNALLALGGDSYLEIIALDPDQIQLASPVAFALDRVRLPRLVGWATRVTDIEQRAQRARDRGYDPGPVQAMSRLRPDGVPLEWRLTRRTPDPTHLVLPFLIDWGSSPHPSQASPTGVTLVDLRAEHPSPAYVRRMLAPLDVDLVVDEGAEAALVATLDSPRGRIVLR